MNPNATRRHSALAVALYEFLNPIPLGFSPPHGFLTLFISTVLTRCGRKAPAG